MIRTTAIIAAWLALSSHVVALEPIPDKLVVLTFDDASKSHFTVARPLLKKYQFGATFFVTEGWDIATNKKDYMSWEEIAQLHKDGFEIGNHTKDHQAVNAKSIRDLAAQVRGINERCKEHGIPTPVSFAYPGNAIAKEALPVLKDLGIKFARRGGSPEYPYKEGKGFAYEPGRDHPLLIPSAGDARPAWTLDDLKRAVSQTGNGKVAVLQFHGVPDTAHDWVTTGKEQFEAYLKHLADGGYKVIALRDLARYLDPAVGPSDPFAIIEDRKKVAAAGGDGKEVPAPKVSNAEAQDGILVHTVESDYQSGPTKVRVLLPDKLDKVRRYPVLYVLPVEAGDGNRYGDGLAEMKKLGIHAKYGLVCVAPTFAKLPWYADHPTDAKIRQESYFLKVVLPLVEKHYPVLPKAEGRLLVGFSKSGWGAFSLLLRHPDTFGKAAAWDAPLMMDEPGKYGSGVIFGTTENFAKYQVTRLLEEQAGKLQKERRLVLLGYGSFRDEHLKAHGLMERLKVAHEYRDGPARKHDWHSGWVEEAVELLQSSRKADKQ